MANRKRQICTFSGMGYRKVQRSNSIRRSKLPKIHQIWLRENDYKNVGWDNVIRLYQKINELLAQPDVDDEPTLEDLFLEADHIGQKYQTREEIESFNQQMAVEVSEISDLVDQQFPETEFELIDYSQTSRSQAKARQYRQKNR
ncbi:MULTISPECIES: hypothetical protein [unclassified Coleofasciculus]|uniref:hypothetical protein n=1 Tax=unclassified Coleofasciculus TaxID=2692782 RepID=UPI00187EA749|nr:MULTISPECIES: hypothetical protein [unclassified Coleofasciculus]MBE9129413.1 hypothetical protein [Coleofasciculus sp. LEGE 07081]MBE9152030.1 hypothetical protein [Coleofasciculus sp. LEGE 07092]